MVWWLFAGSAGSAGGRLFFSVFRSFGYFWLLWFVGYSVCWTKPLRGRKKIKI